MSVRAEPGVRFDYIASAGFAILAAFVAASRKLGTDLTITSGTDGTHSGPIDPHHLGAAYDVRSHSFPDVMKQTVLLSVMAELGVARPQSSGYVTDKFFGWLEAAGSDNEHFHFQLRHGIEYP